MTDVFYETENNHWCRPLSLKLEVDVVWQVQSEEEWQVILILEELVGLSVLLDAPTLIWNICSENIFLVLSPGISTKSIELLFFYSPLILKNMYQTI